MWMRCCAVCLRVLRKVKLGGRVRCRMWVGVVGCHGKSNRVLVLAATQTPTARSKHQHLRCFLCPIAKVVQGAAVDASDERGIINPTRLQTSAAGTD